MKICRFLRPLTQWLAVRGNVRPVLFLAFLLLVPRCFGQATVLWKEGFEEEDFWDRWHVEGGVWAVGSPTSGPGKTFAGARGAATVLDGDYPPGTDARLVRDRVFIVPQATERPRLRFWQWFRGAPGDVRTVEIKVGTGPWQTIVAVSGWDGDDWSRALFDLSPFSGQAVQVAFHFQSDANAEVAAGWYVDEVAVETGPVGSEIINSAEGFETGVGNWTIDHGVWQLGAPSAGPGRAYRGSNCVGTVLDGNYPPGVDSRLISPEFVVPIASDNPRLRFWHWFSVWPGDPARVEINTGGGWEVLSPAYANNSAAWTRPSFDLRAYAGQTVQVAFHFQSEPDENVATGWYIDDVVIETGPVDWSLPTQPEGFESGLGNWSVDNGTWEVGRPTFGPPSPHAGGQCAGTVLAGNYVGAVDSRLISPELIVPGAGELPRLRFWHWLRNQPEDPASVEVRLAGGDWKPLSGPIVAKDGTWARPSFSLGEYAGQRVQIAFRLQSNEDASAGPGWYIDEVVIEKGPPQSTIVNAEESFELGLRDWVVDRGTWQIGAPDTWPETAHSGSSVAGTILDGNHTREVDSRLITPEFIVPPAVQKPRLRFWHWFSIWPGDSGTVEISAAGGPWQALSSPFTGGGVVWTRPWFGLEAFAGQSVRIAFHFQSNADENVARGWYIDDVAVETGAADLDTFNKAEGFETGLGNWSVDNGTWEVGVPGSGPGETFRGAHCAATVLRFTGGRYAPGTDSRLISPEFTVPCAEAGPRLRFAEWYDIAAGDEGWVEIREPGGVWQPALGPVSGASRQWITGFYDLSSYAGKRIQVAFRFRSNDDAEVATGWYLDEIRIQATVLQAVERTAVPEGSLFTYSFGTPCQNLRFTLGPGAPPGVQIEPVLGILVWLPSEDQGPGVFPIEVCAADVDHPSNPIECISLELTVLESNNPPAVDPIEPKTIREGVPLEFMVTAVDGDRPKQALTYSLDQGAPSGATIDPATGAFSWTPSPTQATSPWVISVRVTDDGDPPKSSIATFTASPEGPVTAIRLAVKRVTAELITICMEGGTQGTIYNLETSTDLKVQPNPTEWTVLQTIWKGDQNYCETTHSTINTTRYYRVRRAK